MHREATALLQGCEQHYLEPLSPADRRQLLNLLRKLVVEHDSRP